MEARGNMARNPLRQNMNTYLIDPKPLTIAEPLSKKEVVGLLEAPRVDTPKGLRDRSILSLMVLAGLGISDIHNLDVDDLIDGGSRLKLRGPSGKERSLPLSGEVHTRLVRWMNARLLLAPSSTAVFVSVHWSKARGLPGRRLSKRGINQIVGTYLLDIGKKSRGACGRILKKTFIALFLDEGAGALDLVKAMDIHPKTARAFMRVSQRVRRHD
jgi:integrase/recombinase XerD